MKEKFIEVIEEFKKQTEKDCYSIELLDEETDILSDKIGGIPYLPIGFEYPKDENGNDLALLLQVNLKNIKLENFPGKGILEIFIDKDLNYPCPYQIKYFEEGLDYQTDIKPIQLEISNKISYKINLIKEKAYMPVSDYRFGETITKIVNEKMNINISYDEFTDLFKDIEWYGLIEENIDNPSVCIGGYADFTQYDPREYQNLGKDECLFKLDSNIDFEKIMIGDCGIIFTLINKEHLKKADFETALLDWDCC